jgi:tetratricopeptide (TPR) repeat protein
MSDFTFYQLHKSVLTKYDLLPYPFPARKQREKEIFKSGKEVDIGDLFEELDVLVTEKPEFLPYYSDTISRLSYFLGLKAGQEGNSAAAAHYLQIGVWVNPKNLTLRTNYALALQNIRLFDEALKQYEIVMHDPDFPANPLVWIMAARLYAEKKDYKRAHQLLKACSLFAPDVPEFWEFYLDMEEKVGIKRQEKPLEGSEKLGALAKAMDKNEPYPFCFACNKEANPGVKFCIHCGKSLVPTENDISRLLSDIVPAAAAETQAKFCTSCGAKLSVAGKFCIGCGKPVN